jgi:hypothetical protein
VIKLVSVSIFNECVVKKVRLKRSNVSCGIGFKNLGLMGGGMLVGVVLLSYCLAE